MKKPPTGLFGNDKQRTPGAVGNYFREFPTEEALCEATACPISTEGKPCHYQCAAFKAEVAERDAQGNAVALRFFCHIKAPQVRAIGVVRGLKRNPTT